MLTVRRLKGDDVEAYRAIRLEGLEFAPDAFASTLAREQAFSREGRRSYTKVRSWACMCANRRAAAA